jgi:hypothetical protein
MSYSVAVEWDRHLIPKLSLKEAIKVIGVESTVNLSQRAQLAAFASDASREILRPEAGLRRTAFKFMKCERRRILIRLPD